MSHCNLTSWNITHYVRNPNQSRAANENVFSLAVLTRFHNLILTRTRPNHGKFSCFVVSNAFLVYWASWIHFLINISLHKWSQCSDFTKSRFQVGTMFLLSQISNRSFLMWVKKWKTRTNMILKRNTKYS